MNIKYYLLPLYALIDFLITKNWAIFLFFAFMIFTPLQGNNIKKSANHFFTKTIIQLQQKLAQNIALQDLTAPPSLNKTSAMLAAACGMDVFLINDQYGSVDAIENNQSKVFNDVWAIEDIGIQNAKNTVMCTINNPGIITGVCSGGTDLAFDLTITASNTSSIAYRAEFPLGNQIGAGFYGTTAPFDLAGAADGTSKTVTLRDVDNSSCTTTVTITGAAACPSLAPVTNPDLPTNCTGLDVLFILDESSSLSVAERVAVRTGVTNLLEDLENSGSRAAVATFGNRGAMEVGWTDITTSNLAPSGIFGDYLDGSGTGPDDRDVYGLGGDCIASGTNFESGFRAALHYVDGNAATTYRCNTSVSQDPPLGDPTPTSVDYPELVIFFTDGVPNSILSVDDINDNGTEFESSPAEVGANRAINEANAFKNNGSHIFTILLGASGLTFSISDEITGSGETVWNGLTGVNGNIQTADYYQTEDATEFTNVLSDLIDPCISIMALDDNFSSTPFTAGGTTTTVFVNDIAEGIFTATDALIADNISISSDGGLTGVSIATDGTITIPTNATPNTYTLEYTICLTSDNTICDMANVTVIILEDTDGDNIPDITDIDDDNDGIRDVDECTNYSVYTFNRTSSGVLATNLDVSIVGESTIISTIANQNALSNNLTYNGFNWHLLATNIVPDANGNITASFIPDAGTGGDFIIADAMLVTDGINTYVVNDGSTSWNTTGSWIAQSNANSYLGDNNYAPSPPFTETATWTFTVPILTCDTDMDGIANTLDLDSDGDGCYDKIEAGVTGFTTDGSLTDSLAATTAGEVGMNGLDDDIESDDTQSATTSGSYTITQTNGGTNDFQDAGVQAPDCPCLTVDSDSDGICDAIDIDDDNDGIRDVDECVRYVAQNEGTNWKGATTSTVSHNWGSAVTQSNVQIWTNPSYELHINQNGGDRRYFTSTGANTMTISFSPAVPANEIGYVVGEVEAANTNVTAMVTVTGSATTNDFYASTLSGVQTPESNGSYNGATGMIDLTGSNENKNVLLISNSSATVNSITVTTQNVLALDAIFYSWFAFNTCDTDSDGIPDYLDLDSDADGCFDATEAGHGQAVDANGMIATMSAEVGTNGLDNDVEISDAATTAVNYTLTQTQAGTNDFQTPVFRDASCPYTIPEGCAMEDASAYAGLNFLGTGASVSGGLGLTQTFSNVGNFNGTNIDIKVTVIAESNSSEVYSLGPDGGGDLDFNFTTSAAIANNTATLRFEFFETGTTTPFPITHAFSIGDIDGGGSNGEVVVSGGDLLGYMLANPTNLTVNLGSGNVTVTSNITADSGDPQTVILQFAGTSTIDVRLRKEFSNSAYGFNGSNFSLNNGDCFCVRDIDNDGVCDLDDIDDDNDGIRDVDEGLVDTDSDGMADYLDLDADGDGCYDKIEAGVTGYTTNGSVTDSLAATTAGEVGMNGLDDDIENDDTAAATTSGSYTITQTNAGTNDFQDAGVQAPDCPCLIADSDNDGICDAIDIDDDNDGILDIDEQGSYTNCVENVIFYRNGGNQCGRQKR